jgi:hypothetical protein
VRPAPPLSFPITKKTHTYIFYLFVPIYTQTNTEVPTYTPATALQLFKLYLDGSWFDPMAFRPRTDEDEVVEEEEEEYEEEEQQQQQQEEEEEVTKASLRRRA